ncbi:hypothetical protein C8R43DRAFT_1136290 [Mycena crocata]|nr:hypothetical protein C8R43DRAFT_1136290 [Mycena crocata]
MATLLHLPPEICAIVCEDVDRADLVALCTISRLFRDQAQRIIYRTANLKQDNPQALKSWCLAVTRHPQLAERVHSLVLDLPYDLVFTSDAPKLVKALSRCVNLKALNVQGPHSDVIQGWIISKSPFRLTKFANSYFRNSFLSEFWKAQSEIRVLSLPRCGDIFPCYEDQLPNLTALEVDSLRALPRGRLLQRIQLDLRKDSGHALQKLPDLVRYSATLTTLNILQTWPQVLTTLVTVQTIARNLPSLVHLGMAEDIFDEPFDPFTCTSPISALVKLTRLETFILLSHHITAFHEPALNGIYRLDTPDHLHAFGLALIIACPKLQQAVVGAHVFGPTHEQHGAELTCTLRRAPDSKICSKNGSGFDFDAVSMFWLD